VSGLVSAPVAVRGGELRVAASIGAATGPAHAIEALLREADAAMYRCKQERPGRGVPLPRTPAAEPAVL
jgi:predicted signal transduction protein with EAL and GGDEF domain